MVVWRKHLGGAARSCGRRSAGNSNASLNMAAGSAGSCLILSCLHCGILMVLPYRVCTTVKTSRVILFPNSAPLLHLHGLGRKHDNRKHTYGFICEDRTGYGFREGWLVASLLVHGGGFLLCGDSRVVCFDAASLCKRQIRIQFSIEKTNRSDLISAQVPETM